MYEDFHRGARRTVAWLQDESGRLRGKEFFEGLSSKRERPKMQALLERFGDVGEIRNKEQFRHEEDGLYCFKIFKQRLMCFFDGRLVLITHGFTKKRDKLDRGELARGRRIRENYEKKKGSRG